MVSWKMCKLSLQMGYFPLPWLWEEGYPNILGYTLPDTNSSHLKHPGLEDEFPYGKKGRHCFHDMRGKVKIRTLVDPKPRGSGRVSVYFLGGWHGPWDFSYCRCFPAVDGFPPPGKHNMTMEHPPWMKVIFPIEHGNFPMSCHVFSRYKLCKMWFVKALAFAGLEDMFLFQIFQMQRFLCFKVSRSTMVLSIEKVRCWQIVRICGKGFGNLS